MVENPGGRPEGDFGRSVRGVRFVAAFRLAAIGVPPPPGGRGIRGTSGTSRAPATASGNGDIAPDPGGGMAARAGVPAYTQRQQTEVLATLAIAALMVMYVETMIVPAIPRFQTFFDGASLSLVAWILTSYLLVGVVATPIVAKLGDIYGKKRILLV